MLKKVFICLLCVSGSWVSFYANFAFASATQEIEGASKEKNVAFVLVFEPQASQMDQAREVISDALKKVPGSVKIELDRSDAENSDFVKKYRLLTAPVPLILVASSTGVITGGVNMANATPDRLVKLVPSPKKSEIIKELSQGRAVLITAGRKTMKSVQTVNSACDAACEKMEGKLAYVMIDLDDKAEKNFLNEMGFDMNAAEPMTLVANAMGQISGRFMGAIQSDELVAAATRKMGGCCPASVSKPKPSCGPVK